MSKVLVVGDESAIAELISINLHHAVYDVSVAATADQARAEVDRALPGLVQLDWKLPGESGLQLAREWRSGARTRELPVTMVTALHEEARKIAGLDAGADDYLTKPSSPKELLARSRAVLRRRVPEVLDTPVHVDGLRSDPATRRVTRIIRAEGGDELLEVKKAGRQSSVCCTTC